MVRAGPLLAAIILLGACAPDLSVDGVSVYYQGHPELNAQLRVAIPIIIRDGQALGGNLAGANIYWENKPFRCAGVLADGCSQGNDYYVAWDAEVLDTALTWELAHGIWTSAYGNPGEADNFYSDGGVGVATAPGFTAFVDRLNADIKAGLSSSD